MSTTAGLIFGLRSESGGGDKATILSGSARDSGDTSWIEIPSGQTRVVDLTTTGLGGLDTGTVQASESYALYVIKSQSGVVGAFASLSFSPTGVNVPTGAVIRRVGALATDTNKKIHAFSQVGNSSQRVVQYDGALSSLARLLDGTAQSLTPIDLGPLVPQQQGSDSASVSIVPSGAGNVTSIQDAGGGQQASISVPSTLGFIPTSGTSRMDYTNSTAGGTTSVYVIGFTDTL
ncbi:MAG TPA: hypothetical protein ENK18_02235 [Deltaproteobacteria bacterium]|nr:hypothetical protein [Deltaproteobacteria bacterium]